MRRFTRPARLTIRRSFRSEEISDDVAFLSSVRVAKTRLWQAEHARERLLRLNQQIDVRIEIIEPLAM